ARRLRWAPAALGSHRRAHAARPAASVRGLGFGGLVSRRDAASRLPRHLELWGQLEENNRFLRRLAAASGGWAFVGLGVASYALLVGLYRPLAFHVDAEGEATFIGHLRERVAPSPAEVRYVAKQFLRRYLAYNSLTIQSDLADAWNLMTSELRGQQERQL